MIERVTILFGKKESINNFNCLKRTKFGIEKKVNINKKNNIINKEENEFENKKFSIAEKCLIKNGRNFKYNSFIIIFYFAV